MGTIKGGKIIAFVSDDCPVSMVTTVSKARQLAVRNTDGQLIVMPLQRLSEKHLAMNGMVSNGNMPFITDEQAEKIRLPLFVPLADDLSLPAQTRQNRTVSRVEPLCSVVILTSAIPVVFYFGKIVSDYDEPQLPVPLGKLRFPVAISSRI